MSAYDFQCQHCFEGPMCRHNPATWDDPAPAQPPIDAPVEAPPPVSDPASEPLTVPLRNPRKRAPRHVRNHPLIRFAADWCSLTLHPLQAEQAVAALESASRTVLLLWGRRGGKSLVACLLVLFTAIIEAEVHLKHARPNERIGVGLLANSQDQARQMHRILRELIDSSPRLRRMVESQTADTIRLTNRIDIVVLPCSSRTIRGRTLCAVVIDELGLAQDGAGTFMSPQAAGELVDAVTPATFSFPEGKVWITSTPRWAGSTLYAIAQRGADPSDPSVELLHAAAPELRPDIAVKVWEDERRSYPERYLRETMARWDSGYGGLFEREAIDQCLVDRGNLLPRSGIHYFYGVDPSGGAGGGDPWAGAMVHAERDRIIVDRLDLRGGDGRPFDTEVAIQADAATAADFNSATVLVDNWAKALVVSGFQRHGATVRAEDWTQEKKYTDLTTLRSLLIQGRLEIPRNGHGAELVNQMMVFEQRPTPSGRPRVGAPPGMHDDLLTALMAAVSACERGRSSGRPAWNPRSPFD